MSLFGKIEPFDDSFEVAVWNYRTRKFIAHFPCEGEKRVRIDVHDSLENYGVFKVRRPNGQKPYESGVIDVIDTNELTDWRIDLS